ncbi:basic amino acid ABC transporter substrate-binding protein [Robertmurraya yapensis]|uniref:Basic amino acid ABC transporter substrate-binding protein n=2 Tax=Bacillaceae TaxID=186817 RepID=A0A431W110_9BACI|nr:basic amino acid ABC transporter substrate-binding protein [Bacillus yapensis]RTR29204.1 basic amino acid ABC transporter substrate-binding protein [Bacillus yapensis]TKS94809.1 transporter substrate-binding domain-containing protein [Bacillus yapensis]
MKKITKLSLLFIVALAAILTGCGKSETSGDSDSKTLKVVTNAAYAPMEYMNGDKIEGFDVDFINAVAKEAGYEVEIQHTGWDAMFVEVEDEISDLAVAAITVTDERKESYDFSVPYYLSTNMILVKEGSDIKSAADLKDKKVAVQNGTTGQEAAESILGENSKQLKKFEDNNIAIQELLSGGADAVVADNTVIETYVKNNPDQKLQVVEDATAFDSEFYAILFPKGSELKADFDKALNTIIDNGKYTELYKEWFGTEPDVEGLKAQQ